MNELLCLHRSERYGTCDDEAEAEGQMMSAVPVIRISRPHGNTAVLLWTGGENIRFFAAAGWLMFRKTSAVRAEQREAMQTVSGQFSSGHRNDRNSPSESPRHFAALWDESVIVGYYTSRRKCIPVPQPSAAQQKGADLYGQKRRNRPHLCP